MLTRLPKHGRDLVTSVKGDSVTEASGHLTTWPGGWPSYLAWDTGLLVTHDLGLSPWGKGVKVISQLPDLLTFTDHVLWAKYFS